MGVVLTRLSLLIPAFSLPSAPPALTGPASLLNGTLPYHLTLRTLRARSAASVFRLSPVELSAPNHSTSELLRTLSRMAASKPTSWLSARLDFLSH